MRTLTVTDIVRRLSLNNRAEYSVAKNINQKIKER